jgi:hypothetical protein
MREHRLSGINTGRDVAQPTMESYDCLRFPDRYAERRVENVVVAGKDRPDRIKICARRLHLKS